MAAFSLLFYINLAAAPAHAELVYFGISDPWNDLTDHADEWTYVQQHADGFYVNFLMMYRIVHHAQNLSEATLDKTCSLFSTPNAYLESDIRKGIGASAEQEQRYIQMLHKAGCNVNFTSLNYGWTPERASNLTQFDLTAKEGKRLDFVQVGPWLLNGDINGPSMRSHPGYNEQMRDFIKASDGVSTDSPLGYWAADFGHFHNALISLVRFAHQNNKKVTLMICPYGAKINSYDAKRDMLAAGQNMVRFLEGQHAIPDIWSVTQYASHDLTPVPEQVNGTPANTTSGIAYWLIHHIHDSSHWAHFDVAPASNGNTKAVNAVLRNDSTWLDIAPLLRLRVNGTSSGVTAQLLLDGSDITASAASTSGMALTDSMALWPGKQHHLSLIVLQNGVPVGTAAKLIDGAKPSPAQPGIELTLAPNPGVPNEVHQKIFIPLAPIS